MKMKPWWKSKTVIFNVLAAIVLIAEQFGFADFKIDPTLKTAIVVAVNLFLRFVTRTGITLK